MSPWQCHAPLSAPRPAEQPLLCQHSGHLKSGKTTRFRVTLLLWIYLAACSRIARPYMDRHTKTWTNEIHAHTIQTYPPKAICGYTCAFEHPFWVIYCINMSYNSSLGHKHSRCRYLQLSFTHTHTHIYKAHCPGSLSLQSRLMPHDQWLILSLSFLYLLSLIPLTQKQQCAAMDSTLQHWILHWPSNSLQ